MGRRRRIPSTICCVGFGMRRRQATAIEVVVPEFGEGAQRPKAGKVEDFAYYAPLNLWWPIRQSRGLHVVPRSGACARWTDEFTMTLGYAFLRTTIQKRSKGRTATGVVCYRFGLAAASTIPGKDGSNRVFDYTRRSGIIATGWAAPAGTDTSWSDPITWAHRIEAVDKRKNSRQCRDDVVGIPIELVEVGLAEQAIQVYADRLAALHRTVIQWAYHGPDRGGKNHHVHVVYPGRHVVGLGFSKHRDREQDNPKDRGAPDLTSVHKGIWSEICGGYGIELRWSSETPGHHLGPKICATKRRRLVAETRDEIRETIAASQNDEPVPGQRVLDEIAAVGTGVNAGLTVNQMLQVELQQARHGRPAPRPVAAPVSYQPEVLPPAIAAPQVLPPVQIVPEVPLPVRRRPEVLPPVCEPEVSPPVRAIPAVLPPTRRRPEVLPPPVHPTRGVLPPVRRVPEVVPPTRVAPEALPPVQIVPEVPLPVRRRPEVLPPVCEPEVSPAVRAIPAVLPPTRRRPEVLPPPVHPERGVLSPVRRVPEVVPPTRVAPEVLRPVRPVVAVLPPVRRVPEVVPPTRVGRDLLPPIPQVPEVSSLSLEPEREAELSPVAAIVDVAEQELPHESSATWRAVRNRFSDKTRAGQYAGAAAEVLGARARRREELSSETAFVAEPSRIKALADWLLRCALAVLEHLGMKRSGRTATVGPGEVGALPSESRVARTSTVSRPVAEAKLTTRSAPESVLKYVPRQLEVHALPRLRELLAVSNESFTDMKSMLVNDDEADELGREGLIRLEAQHQHDAKERERAEAELHLNPIRLGIAAEKRKLKEASKKRWFGKAAALEVGAATRKEIERGVVRKTLPAHVEAIRSVCRRMLGWTPVDAPQRFPGGARQQHEEDRERGRGSTWGRG